MMQTARVIVADKERLACRGLRRTLTVDARLEVVAEACTVREALQHIAVHEPDILVVADRLPGLRGFVLVSALRAHLPQIATVVLTEQVNAATAADAVEAGASELIGRNSSEQEIVQAVVAAAQGANPLSARAVADPAIMSQVLSILRAGNAASGRASRYDSTLTLRQVGVLDGLIMAMSNRDIADAEGLAEQTVKHHVSTLIRALQARDRIGVLREAILRGWTSFGSMPARPAAMVSDDEWLSRAPDRGRPALAGVAAAVADDVVVSHV